MFSSFHFFKTEVKGKLLRSCFIDKSSTQGLREWSDAEFGPLKDQNALKQHCYRGCGALRKKAAIQE